MSIEEEFLANAKDGVPGFALAYALLRVAESIRDGCENIALALDRLAPPDEVAVTPLGSVDLRFRDPGQAGEAMAALMRQSPLVRKESTCTQPDAEQGER